MVEDIETDDVDMTGDDGGSPSVIKQLGVRRQARSSRTNSQRESLKKEIEEVRLLLDQGLSTEVQSRLASIIKAARQDASVMAEAHAMISAALEMQGRFHESLETVLIYEQPEARAALDTEANV